MKKLVIILLAMLTVSPAFADGGRGGGGGNWGGYGHGGRLGRRMDISGADRRGDRI